MSSPGSVIVFTPGEHTHLIPYLAALHAACITQDRTIADFLPPLSHDRLLAYWKGCIAEVSRRERVILVLVKDDDANASTNASSNKEEGHEADAAKDGNGGSAAAMDNVRGTDVVGVVALALPQEDTNTTRAGVQRLMLHTSWRRRGGARKLLEALEREALSHNRTLLTLITEVGTPAVDMYRNLGWTEVGVIPRYEMSPSGQLSDAAFYYKELTTHRQQQSEED